MFYRNKITESPQTGGGSTRSKVHSPVESFHVRLSAIEGNMQRVEYKIDVLLQIMRSVRVFCLNLAARNMVSSLLASLREGAGKRQLLKRSGERS